MQSPSSLLARLSELKKWQEAQQQRLMRQHNQRLQETEKTLPNYEDLEGVARLKNDVEETVLSPPKDFEALLEEKLADDGANENVGNGGVKPKRPFLKKGAGLSRFRMSLEDRRRPFKRKVSELKVPEVGIKTKESDSNVNCFNRNVIAQINRFAAERMNENDDTREMLIFENLEKRAMNSSFSSTNSSIVRMLSSTPQKVLKPPIPEEPPTNDSEIIERLIHKHLHKDNIESLLENLQNYQGISTENTPTVSSCSSVISDDVCEKQMKDAETNTEADETTELLTQKLLELEKEIERFRFENGKVSQLRRDLEIEQREFQKERKKFITELENEKTELRFEIEEERKKLAKDKMVFEKYTKEMRNKPNKQERAEISNLKIEIANLKETQKLKDTKNSTTQARLRNQIKSLEKDRAHLQEEIEKLTKQNAKLVATQKINAKPSDTKMLQEINKNLNKLTKVQNENKSKSVVSFEQTNKSKENLFYGCGNKENDLNVANSFEDFDIEKHYEEVFGRNADLNGLRLPNTTVNESKKDETNEITLSDGSKEIKYTNGNVKITSPNGNTIKTKYYNGDLKETNLRDGYIKYFYCETKAWQTTYADGTEILEFPNGQIEKKLSDGTSEIKFPDGIVRKLMADGTEEITYLDGSVVTVGTNGDRILLLANGQKEIHTKEHKRREYPDGTTKILYPDGTQETRYANGRIRIKDKEGNLVMDSFS